MTLNYIPYSGLKLSDSFALSCTTFTAAHAYTISYVLEYPTRVMTACEIVNVELHCIDHFYVTSSISKIQIKEPEEF